MKKIIFLCLAAALALSLTACGESGVKELDMTLEEEMSAILEGVELPKLMNTTVTDENTAIYFFIEPVKGAEALVSEPMIGSIPHSVGLMRVPAGTDAEIVAANIRDAANPRKWICVEAEKYEVITRGRTILLVMSTTEVTDQIAANFKALYD